MNALVPVFVAGLIAGVLTTGLPQDPQAKKPEPVDLGNFSVSLAVKDIKSSRAFYEKLGFTEVAGDMKQNWIVLKNGTTKIGLFQGMLPRNTLTFNPGWNSAKETLQEFQDVREIQRVLKERGVTFQLEADAKSEGPAFFQITDPDGNPILVDQHVAKPKR
ncbi:MAG: VOC family protein [Planctomycetes bacterium]|nr:VOC family protein [Planctomycetota bacterium]